MTEKYIATVDIGTSPPTKAGSTVSFGNRKGQIPAENKQAFIDAGQVAIVPQREGKE